MSLDYVLFLVINSYYDSFAVIIFSFHSDHCKVPYCYYLVSLHLCSSIAHYTPHSSLASPTIRYAS